MPIKPPQKQARMTPDAFRTQLKELGLTQAKVAKAWNCSPATLSRWATGKTPIPPWVRYALAGVASVRMKEAAAALGYPWPPIGYNA